MYILLQEISNEYNLAVLYQLKWNIKSTVSKITHIGICSNDAIINHHVHTSKDTISSIFSDSEDNAVSRIEMEVIKAGLGAIYSNT